MFEQLISVYFFFVALRYRINCIHKSLITKRIWQDDVNCLWLVFIQSEQIKSDLAPNLLRLDDFYKLKH